MDAVDVEPGSDLLALLYAGVRAQRAGRLRLHLGGRGVLLKHDGGATLLCRVGVLLHDAPTRTGGEEQRVGTWVSEGYVWDEYECVCVCVSERVLTSLPSILLPIYGFKRCVVRKL